MAQAPNPFEKQAAIPGIQHIIAVSSGKGGVGKSTVSVNLATSLAQKGLKVGLLDADIYGPSIPRMLGTIGQKPEVDENNRIKPILRHKLKLMSIGYLVDEEAAIVWRGPMLFKAIDQFLRDVDWGELDFLIVDLPPGTGDVQLSLAQKVPVSAAISVCTPQNIALTDVKKSIDMFKRINTPILGMVVNMAYFSKTDENGNEQKLEMFPRGDLDKYMADNKIDNLVEIPFYQEIAMGSEIGLPVAVQSSTSASSLAFQKLANTVVARFM